MRLDSQICSKGEGQLVNIWAFKNKKGWISRSPGLLCSTSVQTWMYWGISHVYDINPPGHCGPHLPSAGVNQHSPFEVNEESQLCSRWGSGPVLLQLIISRIHRYTWEKAEHWERRRSWPGDSESTVFQDMNCPKFPVTSGAGDNSVWVQTWGYT